MKNSWIALLTSAVLLSSCGNKASQTEETVSRGEITVSADESLQPVLEAEKEAFEAKTKYAKIHTVYTSELNAVQLMLQDSARVAVTTRNLKADERKIFDEKNIRYRAYQMATDAVALITNGNTSDTLISITELKDVMLGKITKWNELSHGKSSQKITLVFDRDNSSNLQFLLDTLQIPDKKKTPIFAVNSNKEVIAYIQKNPGAIGFIGVNWISDIDDPEHPKFTKGIKVMGVSPRASTVIEDYLQPFQYAIALKKYPLSRNVYLITKEAKRGLGTGFINYALGDQGQRIILKSGLLPSGQILRLVQVKGM
ncbi:MAG: substrate-binding domain-containing protein [Siphonobacter sp.]